MKKLALILASLCMLAGCGKNEAHWSHKACVEDIVNCRNLVAYSYEVEELDHEYKRGDDEVYCFDITITAGDWSQRYCCYAVVDGDEVMYVDCDKWEGD